MDRIGCRICDAMRCSTRIFAEKSPQQVKWACVHKKRENRDRVLYHYLPFFLNCATSLDRLCSMMTEIVKVPVRQLRIEQNRFAHFRGNHQLFKSLRVLPAGKGCFTAIHIFVQVQQQRRIASSLLLIVNLTETKVMVSRVFYVG
jgi:hypothetical protein